MNTRSKKIKSDSNKLIDIGKLLNSISELSSFKNKNKVKQEVYITPFDNFENSNFTLKGEYVDNLNINSDLRKCERRNLLKEIDENDIRLVNNSINDSSNGKKRVYINTEPPMILKNQSKKKIKKNTWTKIEEISFIVVSLMYKLFKKKISLFYLNHLIVTRTYLQTYRHYYGHKKIIEEFSQLFFSYFDCSKINNLDVTEYTLEELFNIFKNNVFDPNFISYFYENTLNNRCIKYFQNIYSIMNFEPQFYVTNVDINNQTTNKNAPKVNIYNKHNSSFEILKTPNSDSKSNSNNEEKTMTARFKLKNIKLQIDNDMLDKLYNISSSENNKNIILDDSFIVQYLISEFNQSSNPCSNVSKFK